MVFPAGAGPGADYRREVRQPAQTRPFYPGAPLSPPNVSPAGLRFEYGRFWAAYRSWLVAGTGAADVFEPASTVPPPPANVGAHIATAAPVPYVAPPVDRTAAYLSWVAASGAADPWKPGPRTSPVAPNPGPFFFTGGADPTGVPFAPTSSPEAYVSWLLAGGPGDPLRPQPRRLTEPWFAGPAAGYTGGADPTGQLFRPDQTVAAYVAWSRLPGPGRTTRHELRVPPGTTFDGPFPFTGGADPTGAVYVPLGVALPWAAWLLLPGPGATWRPQERRTAEPYAAAPGAWVAPPGDPTGAVYLPAGVRLPFAAWATLPGPGGAFRPAGAVPPGTAVPDWLAGAPAPVVVLLGRILALGARDLTDAARARATRATAAVRQLLYLARGE